MHSLPKTGWLTHTEQITPAADEFWHMQTTIAGGYTIVSLDTTIAPPDIKRRLGARLPPYITVISQGRAIVHFEVAADKFTAQENHYICVRGVIDGKLAGQLVATQPVAKA